MAPVIVARELRKEYRIRRREEGAFNAMRSLVRPSYETKSAVRAVSFSAERGERIAFLGPNGAGKSTTIKMLTGVLHPTAGHIAVVGLHPWRERRALCHKIGVVFGQRSQLWYHLPPRDAYLLLGRMFGVERGLFDTRLRRLIEIFGIGPYVEKPVRQLSLGERMRCELVASLLHAPEVLFLDEPTIGLDVTSKAVIRDFIRALSDEFGTTVFLTSHDTGDVEQVCDRVLLINQGALLLDASIEDLQKRYLTHKLVTLHSADESVELDLPGVRARSTEKHRATFEVDLAITPIGLVLEEAVRRLSVLDITIENPPLEGIIRKLYEEGCYGQ